MAFLDWLDRHFASNPYLWCADELVWPIDHFPDGHPGAGVPADDRQQEPRTEASGGRDEGRALH